MCFQRCATAPSRMSTAPTLPSCRRTKGKGGLRSKLHAVYDAYGKLSILLQTEGQAKCRMADWPVCEIDCEDPDEPEV